jgi:VWFA-related protein
MTSRLIVASVMFAIAGGAPPQSSQSDARGSVTLTAAVVDDDGRPVSTLARDAFTIREDGRPVEIKSVRGVSVGNGGAHRGLVVLLDDANVSPVYTTNIQTIARAFLARANAPDVVSVTSLSHANEELITDPRASASRVDEFRAGSIVAQANETFSTALRRLTNISRELALVNDGRNAIVCIGRPAVFDLVQPIPGSASLMRAPWIDAIHVLVHNNTSIYLIDPSGLTGRTHLVDGGFAADTGGAAFVNSNDFNGAVDRIWSEAGHYYVIEYAPTGPDRVLHSIEVSVRGRGLHVHAPRYRGDYHPPSD